jgi:hypothetical protein
MNSLDIFKQAGLKDILMPGLIGAGVGGLGTGVASMFGGPDDEEPGAKRHRILSNVLKGTALGGGAGLGYGAAFGKSELPHKLQEIMNQAKDKGVTLDQRPFSEAHTVESGIHSMLDGNYTAKGIIGGLAGMGVEAKKHGTRAMDKIYAGLGGGDKKSTPPTSYEGALDAGLKAQKNLNPSTNIKGVLAHLNHLANGLRTKGNAKPMEVFNSTAAPAGLNPAVQNTLTPPSLNNPLNGNITDPATLSSLYSKILAKGQEPNSTQFSKLTKGIMDIKNRIQQNKEGFNSSRPMAPVTPVESSAGLLEKIKGYSDNGKMHALNAGTKLLNRGGDIANNIVPNKGNLIYDTKRIGGAALKGSAAAMVGNAVADTGYSALLRTLYPKTQMDWWRAVNK